MISGENPGLNVPKSPADSTTPPEDVTRNRSDSLYVPSKGSLGGHFATMEPLLPTDIAAQAKARETQAKTRETLEQLGQEKESLKEFSAKRLSQAGGKDKADIQKKLNECAERIKNYSSNVFTRFIFASSIKKDQLEVQKLGYALSNLNRIEKRISEIDAEIGFNKALEKFKLKDTPENRKELQTKLSILIEKKGNNASQFIKDDLLLNTELPMEVIFRAIGTQPNLAEIMNQLKGQLTPTNFKVLNQRLLTHNSTQFIENPSKSHQEALKNVIQLCIEHSPDDSVNYLLKSIPNLNETNKTFIYQTLTNLPFKLHATVAKKVVDSNSPSTFAVIKGVLKEETDKSTQVGSLFRINSLYSEMQTLFLKKEMASIDQEILASILVDLKESQTIVLKEHRLKEVMKLSDSPEDQIKFKAAEQRIQARALKLNEKIMKKLNETLSRVELPKNVKMLFSELYEQVSEKFGHKDAEKQVISSLMLRYINPLIIKATKDTSDQANGVFITKVIMNIANQITSFKKEPEMVFLKEFVTNEIPKMKNHSSNFVGQLAVKKDLEGYLASKPTTEGIKPSDLANQKLDFLFQTLDEYFSLETSNYLNAPVGNAFKQLPLEKQKALEDKFPDKIKELKLFNTLAVDTEITPKLARDYVKNPTPENLKLYAKAAADVVKQFTPKTFNSYFLSLPEKHLKDSVMDEIARSAVNNPQNLKHLNLKEGQLELYQSRGEAVNFIESNKKENNPKILHKNFSTFLEQALKDGKPIDMKSILRLTPEANHTALYAAIGRLSLEAQIKIFQQSKIPESEVTTLSEKVRESTEKFFAKETAVLKNYRRDMTKEELVKPQDNKKTLLQNMVTTLEEGADITYLLEKMDPKHYSILYEALAKTGSKQKSLLNQLQLDLSPEKFKAFLNNLLENTIQLVLKNPSNDSYQSDLYFTLPTCLKLQPDAAIDRALNLLSGIRPENKHIIYDILVKASKDDILQEKIADKILNSNLLVESAKGILKIEVYQSETGSLNENSLYIKLLKKQLQKEQISSQKVPENIKKILSEHYELAAQKWGSEKAKKHVLETFHSSLPKDKPLKLTAENLIGKIAVLEAAKSNKGLFDALKGYFALETSDYFSADIRKAFEKLTMEEQTQLTETFPQAKLLVESRDFLNESEKAFKKPIKPGSNERGVFLIKSALSGKAATTLSFASLKNPSAQVEGQHLSTPRTIEVHEQFQKDFKRQTFLLNGKVVADGAGIAIKFNEKTHELPLLQFKAGKLKEEIDKLNAEKINFHNKGEPIENFGKIQTLIDKFASELTNVEKDIEILKKDIEKLTEDTNESGILAYNHLIGIEKSHGEQVLKNVAMIFQQSNNADIADTFSKQFKNPWDSSGLDSGAEKVHYDFLKDDKGNYHLKINTEYHMKDQENRKLVGKVQVDREIIIPESEMSRDWIKDGVPPNSKLQIKDSYKMVPLTKEEEEEPVGMGANERLNRYKGVLDEWIKDLKKS